MPSLNRARVLFVPIAAMLALAPASLGAWGFEAHKFVMDRAIALLPPEIRPFFEANRQTLVERAIDPDTWITAGYDAERPNHFLDLDWQGFGPYPFNGLPRDYTTAAAKFGRNRLREIHKTSIHELEDGLAPELREELERLTLPFSDDSVPSDAELRIAQAQLVGWLEGLFHGIQTALFAQQMAAQAQLDEMRRHAALNAAPADQRPGSGPTGPYL